jgi:hypothetical protein
MRVPLRIKFVLGILGVIIFAVFQNFANYSPQGFSGSVVLRPCSYDPTAICAEFYSQTTGTFEIKMAINSPAFNVTTVSSGAMGLFGRPAGQKGFFYIYTAQGNNALGNLYILDLDARTQLTTFTDNYPVSMLYFDYVTDPAGNKYPFSAPGANVPSGSLCIFTPYASQTNPGCGNHLRAYSVTPGGIRTNGGWMSQGSNGWTNINLTFNTGLLTISGQTGDWLSFLPWQSCPIMNGTGYQVLQNGAWGSCMLRSCNSGFIPAPDGLSCIPTLGQQVLAATTTAQNNASCTTLGDFYWEIGDGTGPLGSGAIGSSYSSSTMMDIASSSKWVLGAYAVQKQYGVLSANDVQDLEMGAGYVNFSYCAANQTVDGCFNYLNNNVFTPNAAGKFYYSGGNFQYWGHTNSIVKGMNSTQLTAEFASVLGSDVISTSSIYFSTPQLAGGLRAMPAAYGAFLRKILNQQLLISSFLSYQPVCTLPSVCPSALYSPVPAAEHYSIAHWIEDDPSQDGAFSSPGKYGFYPWIDASRSFYGVLARVDTTTGEGAGYNSQLCGQLIRAAWMTGSPQ